MPKEQQEAEKPKIPSTRDELAEYIVERLYEKLIEDIMNGGLLAQAIEDSPVLDSLHRCNTCGNIHHQV